MKNKNIPTEKKVQKELKKVIKNSFAEMLNDVKNGTMSVKDFSDKLKTDYSIKKMELTGSLF